MTPPLDVAAVRAEWDSFCVGATAAQRRLLVWTVINRVPVLLDALETAQAEVERLRAETVPRSALVQVGVDYCTVHEGVRDASESACDLCAVDDRECRLVPAYVLRSTQEGDGDGRVGDEIGAT